jgi:hypothetical protein
VAVLGRVFVLLACGGFLLACQGDQQSPSGLGRELDLTAGGLCKDDAFTSAAAIYTDSSVQNAKLQACKDILNLFKQNNVEQGELAIDALLVAIFNDYWTPAGVEVEAIAAVGTQSLEQSVGNYIVAACGLAGGDLSASECLVPNDALDGILGSTGLRDLEGWIAAGPLTGTEEARGTGLLPNGIYGFGVVSATGVYVTVAERPRLNVVGPCPGNYPNDCQTDVFDVDVDRLSPTDSLTFVDVESCVQAFGVVHVHCPEDGDCQPGTTTTDLDLVTEDACTAAGYALMGFWGKFAFQTTRPIQWIIDATPAYAGTTTRLGLFSPTVLSDDDPRSRDVIVNVTANYPSGSEGTIIKILKEGVEIGGCVTVGTGTYTSHCEEPISVLVPADITLQVTAAKTGGDGAYNASKTLTLTPGNPPRGSSATVEFNLQPPGKKKRNS